MENRTPTGLHTASLYRLMHERLVKTKDYPLDITHGMIVVRIYLVRTNQHIPYQLWLNQNENRQSQRINQRMLPF